MRKKEYKFNPQTLTYEPVERPKRLQRYLVVRRTLFFVLASLVVNLVYSLTYYTPKLRSLEAEGSRLAGQFAVLDRRIESSDEKVSSLAVRDNYVYRSLFGADTLAVAGINTPYPEGVYSTMNGDYNGIVRESWKKLDALTREVYRQSRSLDELQVLSKDKEKMAASIPAIWPINKKDLRGAIGAYGRRLHPIYKRYLPHKGIDFGGRKGDPIYATGNGKVVHSEKGLRRKGYGQQLVIDHGFGYKTRYAHLSERLVVVGQEVKRGELIGYMGSTGGSTGPHLHYEVIYMGNNVDPINYFRRDMSEAEFDHIIEQAKSTTFETLEGTSNE